MHEQRNISFRDKNSLNPVSLTYTGNQLTGFLKWEKAEGVRIDGVHANFQWIFSFLVTCVFYNKSFNCRKLTQTSRSHL